MIVRTLIQADAAEPKDLRNELDAVRVELARVRAKLGEQNQKLHSTFELPSVGMAHVDLDGKWLAVNDTLCGIVGYSRDELVGQPVEALLGEVVVLAAVFPAVLTVREDVDEIVAAVIAPGCGPLAGALGIVVGVLATAPIAAFEIAGRVDDETGAANTVTHGLRRHARAAAS